MASSQAGLASPGALLAKLANITKSSIPPALHSYLDYPANHLLAILEHPLEFAEAYGLPPSAVYSTLACIFFAAVIYAAMSRYKWGRQEPYLPPIYPSGSAPHISDADYTYVSSADLEVPYSATRTDLPYPTGRPADPRLSMPRLPPEPEEDDYLHIRHRGREYTLQFPAFSIGDGKLRVRDIQERIAFLMEIPPSRISHIRLLYKGRELQDPMALARDYGCKNNSELLAMLPDRFDEVEPPRHRRREYVDSEGETVIVTDDYGRISSPTRGRRRNSMRQSPSPRTSGANLELYPEPESQPDPGVKRSKSRARKAPSSNPQIRKLEEISDHFEKELLPKFEEFIENPPADKQKRTEEHKRLEEITMQQVLLKLDEVETGGDEEVRACRKDLVKYVQSVLKQIDDLK